MYINREMITLKYAENQARVFCCFATRNVKITFKIHRRYIITFTIDISYLCALNVEKNTLTRGKHTEAKGCVLFFKLRVEYYFFSNML